MALHQFFVFWPVPSTLSHLPFSSSQGIIQDIVTRRGPPFWQHDVVCLGIIPSLPSLILPDTARGVSTNEQAIEVCRRGKQSDISPTAQNKRFFTTQLCQHYHPVQSLKTRCHVKPRSKQVAIVLQSYGCSISKTDVSSQNKTVWASQLISACWL